MSSSELDQNVLLNVQADKLAKQQMKREIRAMQEGRTENVAHLPFEPCVIQEEDQQRKVITLSSELESQLEYMISSDNIREYCCRKGKFSNLLASCTQSI